jgi:hypothetical protein
MKDSTRPAKQSKVRLQLRGIAGRFTWDEDTIWAWYRFTPQRWSFLTDAERTGILTEQATGYGELLGRKMRLRITYRPYPAHEWAERLDNDTPNPLDMSAWDDLLERSQRVLHRLSTAEAEHYIGFEVGPRRMLDHVAEAVLPSGLHTWLSQRTGLGDRTIRRLASDIDHVDRVVIQQLDGRPATAEEVEYLIDRSRALGVPQTVPSTPNPEGVWEQSDLHTFADGIAVEEHPLDPFVTVHDGRGEHPVSRCVTVLTLGRVERMPYPPTDLPLLALPLALGFPVEIVATGQLHTGEKVARGLRRQITRIQSQIDDYQSNKLSPPPGLQSRADHALGVGEEIDSPVSAVAGRWRGWVRFAVSGSDPEEVADRAGQLTRLFAGRNIPLHREPQSRELVAEFMPHEPVSSGAYVRQLPVRMWAATLPQVTSRVGDRQGPLIGYTVSGPRRPVMLHPQYGPEALDAPGLCPMIAGLGGGKSYLLGLIAEQAALRGTGTTVLDPSAGAFTRLAELPHLRRNARVIDLVNGRPGTLSPWAVIADPRADHFDTPEQWRTALTVAAQERMVLAEDICRSLLPLDLAADRDLRLALTEAVSEVGGAPDMGLRHVVERLAGKGTVGDAAARFLANVAGYPRANLFFESSTDIEERDVIDETLVVITFSGLVIPQAGIDRSQWTTEEQISVPLLNLATALTFRRVARKPRTERHVALMDELGILEQFTSFRSVFTRFSRDSRKLNTFVGKADQTPRGVINMGLLPFIGSAFIGVTDSDDAAADSLQILGLKPEPRYADVLRRLPRPKPGRPLDYRDFVYRDPAGLVERVRITTDHRPHLRDVLDTTPRPQSVADDVGRVHLAEEAAA